MGDETTRLENEIRQERAGLAESIQALEGKMSRASDWRYQFAKRPFAGVAIAFVGGIALSRLVAGENSSAAREEEDWEEEAGASRARQGVMEKSGFLHTLQAAVIAAVAQGARGYIQNLVSRRNAPAEYEESAHEGRGAGGMYST